MLRNVPRWVSGSLTPADAQVDAEVVPLGQHRDCQQVVQVYPLHQQPVAVCYDAILHHHYSNPAAHIRLCNLQNTGGPYYNNVTCYYNWSHSAEFCHTGE